ncbi:MAG: C25 family cysteine peptidase [bacterium]
MRELLTSEDFKLLRPCPTWRGLLTSTSLLLLLLLSSSLWGETIVKSVGFDEPAIKEIGDVCIVSIDGLPLVANPGEPLLPAKPIEILLPYGEEVVEVSAIATEERTIQLRKRIEWGQPEFPISQTPESYRPAFERVDPNPEIYGGSTAFPLERVRFVTTQTFRGFNIAFLRVYPVQYNGREQTIVFAPSIELRIETRPSEGIARRSNETLRRGAERDFIHLRERFEGEQESDRILETYRQASCEIVEARFSMLGSIVDSSEAYPYVIITNSTLASVFDILRIHRERMGLRAKIVDVSDIASNYSGNDLQEKIRNFIKDAYLNWGTEFVLLAGDNEIIPHRGLYAAVGGYVDLDIPSDLYYAALDGTWNDDNDQYWGEPGEADLIPEVTVGRASVATTTEASRFVTKLTKYENQPVTSQIKKALMVGELLWDDPTWAGDYKDEIKNGSSAHGYTTAGFPASFDVGTLYDRDLYPDSWDKEDLIPILNNGMHIVNHLGHSNTTYGLRMYTSDVRSRFTNNGVDNSYFLIYTQGCYSGSFDNRTSGGSYTEDCIGEQFVYTENAAVAFIGNTRYGWGARQSTRGSSQFYDRQFFDAIFGEGITVIGKANDDSRIDNIWCIDMGAMRWVYYELVLLGDPAMDIWTDTPESLLVFHPDVVYVGENQIEIGVSDVSSPIPLARVTLFNDSTFVFGFTNSEGAIYLDPSVASPCTLFLAVKAHNFYTYFDTILVEQPNNALVQIDSVIVDDDDQGESIGNSNGKIDAGERLQLQVPLENIGVDTAYSVSAMLLGGDPYVTLIDSIGEYGDIAPGEAILQFSPFVFDVSPAAPDSHTIDFGLSISYQDTTYEKHFFIPVVAPGLRIIDIQFSDSLFGNNDGCLETGETFDLVLTFENIGGGDGVGIDLILSADDPYIWILEDSVFIDSIPSGMIADASYFRAQISPYCPEFYQLRFGIEARFANGRIDSDSLVIYVGGSLSEDCESGSYGWTHSDLRDGYIDQWHLDTYRNNTPGGSYSWKFGGEGSTPYGGYAHGALVTPELCIGPGAMMTFWHWVSAELQNQQYAWDGGIVEISSDGGKTWVQIYPEGGYPHRIYPSSTCPFPAETPCFGGTNGWKLETFDLSDYPGKARVRFRFGSDGSVAGEGWYVDDIVITDDISSVRIDDLEALPDELAFHIRGGNPITLSSRVFFDVPASSRISITMFDVRGRLVSRLVDGLFTPGRYECSLGIGENLSPGVYFLRMDAEGRSLARKIVVAK